jgi:SAM-dependent methyltransferase
MDLKETDILGEGISKHWYYRSKAKAMMKMLGAHRPLSILDVGAGSGFFSRYLLANSFAHDACCVDISYPTDSEEIESGKPIYFRRSIESSAADLVLLMDVLEHVDDDVGLLAHYVQKANKGTLFLISVPAFAFLWSEHDVFLEHKRRYQLAQIEQVATNAGLTVKAGSYYFGSVFPIAAVIRLASQKSTPSTSPKSQLTLHHPLVNGALGALCSLEIPLMGSNRIAGLSAFCLAEKV